MPSLNPALLSPRRLAPYRLKMGAELEFYLEGAGDLHGFTALLEAGMSARNIPPAPLQKERGEGQYEIALPPMEDPLALAEALSGLKEIITEAARKSLYTAQLQAKPYPEQPGSAMQIHLHLMHESGESAFAIAEDGSLTDALAWCIGGMLALLPQSMVIFAPFEASYRRFGPKLNAPTTVSWGGNNRTAALRLPDGPREEKRIEHRVPGSDAEPAPVIAAILAGAAHGLRERISAPPRMYGDASLSMYKLSPLPASLAEAREAYEKGEILKAMFLARTETIKHLLSKIMPLESIEIIDESAAHAGHAGNPGGGEGTHLRLRVVSPAFHGLTRPQRHRKVMEALKDEFAAGLHALAIEAKAPGE